ncbi:MAG: hypothetical protein V4719_15720 [Planctomycetota bacterium]
MDRFTAEQVRRNREAREGWDLYHHHRERVTNLLLYSAGSPDQTLCVLGAGNCNDLDLKRLRERFRQIQLIDLDGEALAAGCEQQGMTDDAGILLLGGIDVTNLAPRLQAWKPDQPVAAHEIQGALLDAMARPLPGLPTEQFDVVVSVGLLTQIIEMVLLSLGPQHPQFLELLSAVRLRHLRLLLELTKPGGTAALIFEVVSTLTCPELLETSEAALWPVLQQAIEKHNFFTGANPAIINQIFQRDPELSAAIVKLGHTNPWLWTFFTHTYAVCAFTARKTAKVSSPVTP